MPIEIIDLRKRSSLMNAMPKTSSVFLVKPSDMHSLEMHVPALPVALDNTQSPDADASVISIVHGDEKPSSSSHTPLREVSDGFDLEWSSYEHEYRIRGPYWFLYPLGVATVGIVFGIATHSYLFISFVGIAFLMLTYYAKRPPRMLTYAIEKRGVWMGDKIIDYRKLKSFWIFTHALMAPELLLETENLISPLIHVRLEGIDPNDVKNIISRYLPEKEQKDLASHQIARIIGF